jgi:hypothetical protein
MSVCYSSPGEPQGWPEEGQKQPDGNFEGYLQGHCLSKAYKWYLVAVVSQMQGKADLGRPKIK